MSTKSKVDRVVRAIFIGSAIGIIAALLFACNPVKRVIGNEKYYKEVRDTVVSRGECVNDTIIQSKSDTLITFDTLFAIDFQTDTMTVDREITKTVTKVVTKTVKIRDTVTQVVRDNSLIDLQKKEISKHLSEQSKLKEKIVTLEADKKEIKKARNKWRLYFWLLMAAIGIVLFRKPLLSVGRKLIGLHF